MSLSKGTGIRITTENTNLFAQIVKDNGHSITIKLSEKQKSNNFSSDLMEIVSANKNESLKPLSQYYSIKVNGLLINELTGEKKHLLAGTATID